MPRASHRVDLLLVPVDPQRIPCAEAFAEVEQGWRDAGLLEAKNGSGLVLGGFRRLWLDLPDRLWLYANHQGGYYVRCPQTGGNLAHSFSAAVQDWRRGGRFALDCPHCGQSHALDAVTLAPPGAFAKGAVIFSDVGSVDLADGVIEVLLPVLGESREIVRRVG